MNSNVIAVQAFSFVYRYQHAWSCFPKLPEECPVTWHKNERRDFNESETTWFVWHSLYIIEQSS